MTLPPPEWDELLGASRRSVTALRRGQQSWWLRPLALPDNSGANGFPLPLARIQADYDVPVLAIGTDSSFRCRTLTGPGRRYVSEVGYRTLEPNAMGCMFMLPTISL